MFDRSKETQDNINEAAKSFDEAAQEVKKQMTKFDRTMSSVKAHIHRHQTAYTIGGTVLAVAPLAFAGGMSFRRPIEVLVDFKPSIAPVFNNHNIGNHVENVVNNTVNNGGHMAKIVKAILPDGTELIFESSGDAAKMLAEKVGIPLERAQWWVSRCANGKVHDAFQHQFENIGLRTTG